MDAVQTLGSQAAQVQTGDLTNETKHRTTFIEYPSRVIRKLAGLKPWKLSYLSLYDSLDNISDRLVACAGVFFAIAAGVPLPLIGLIFGRIINDFPLPEDALRTRIIELLGVAVAYFLVTAIYVSAFGLTSEKISIKLRQRLLECLLHLDQAYFDTHDLDINSLITAKIDTIKAGTSEKVGIFIQSISYFIAAFTVGFILNAKITGILLASAIPAIALTFFVLSPLITKCSRACTAKSEQANGIVENALRAVRTVQAYDMIGAVCQQHLSIVDEATKSTMRKAIFSASQTGLIFFIAYAANGLAFFLGSRESEAGPNAGTVFAVVLLIIDASFVVGQFAPFLEIFARAATARGSLQVLFDVGTVAKDGIKLHVRNENKPDLHGCDVHFKDVSFSYPARSSVKALNNVNLTFKAGKFSSLVGTSGGGKSTLVSLLLRTYDFEGSIAIGAHDVRSIDSAHFRSLVAVLEQECVLFSGTIFDNVCYGLVGLQLSEEERVARCNEAIKAAGVDFLHHLPRGIHTRISNEIQLSGGQKQRICLARALVKKPAVLILDEPTSALDARSEVLVMEAVRRAAASGTTVIMVAHRLSTVLDADHVIVMGEGKVVEQGSPAAVAGRPSVFAKLLRTQNTSFVGRQASTNFLQRKLSREKTDVTDEEGAQTRGTSLDTDAERQTTPPAQRLGLWALARRVGSLIRPDAYIVLLGVVGSAVAGGVLLGESIVFGSLVQLLNTISNGFGRSQADFYCLMFFVLGCIALVAYISSGSAFGVSSARLTAAIQVRNLEHILHLDIEWFAQQGHSVHDLMGAFTKDPGDLSSLSGIALGTIFTVITSVCGGIILAHAVAWKIAVVLLAAVPIMVVAGYLRLRVITLSEVKHREAYQGATSLAVEACRSRKTVSALGIEQHLLQEYNVALQKPFRQSQKFSIVSSALLAICLAIPYFVYALAYWWGSKQVRNGTYSTRQFFTVLPALLFSAQAAGQLFSLSPEIARAKTAARSIFTLLDARSTIMGIRGTSVDDLQKVQTPCSSPASISEKPSIEVPKLRFDSVSLSYSGNSKKMALNSIDVSIAHGETVAFVGPSGGGKSSAISLIERFFDPTSGGVLLDGVDIRTLDVRRLRRSMGLVSQESDLFSGSISYNVKLGAAPGEPVSDADVETACRRCGLHDFISSLPDGYNTECGSGSLSKLSGGQKQRLAIARALVRDPQILLLDEPTSALDAHSEAHVQATLAEAAKGRTTVIVAHRLASIQHANKICVFDEGRIVASGTHSELVQSCPLYASMAKAQSLI